MVLGLDLIIANLWISTAICYWKRNELLFEYVSVLGTALRFVSMLSNLCMLFKSIVRVSCDQFWQLFFLPKSWIVVLGLVIQHLMFLLSETIPVFFFYYSLQEWYILLLVHLFAFKTMSLVSITSAVQSCMVH